MEVRLGNYQRWVTGLRELVVRGRQFYKNLKQDIEENCKSATELPMAVSLDRKHVWEFGKYRKL